MNGEIVPVGSLTAADRARMLALMEEHFEGVTRPQFERDLSEKSSAVLLRDEGGEIRGFSTLMAYRSSVAPGVGVVCSGDTIVQAGFWGSTALARTWIGAARTMALGLGCDRTVWLLIVSGFRTYRFLPVFFRDFVPCPGRETPADQNLLDLLAAERYGRKYDAPTGIVRFDQPQRLGASLVATPPGRAIDPHIRFFLDRNPGHARGDELACLCDLADGNLTQAGRRMVFGARGETLG